MLMILLPFHGVLINWSSNTILIALMERSNKLIGLLTIASLGSISHAVLLCLYGCRFIQEVERGLLALALL